MNDSSISPSAAAKIGILTTHDSPNYGAILQTYASQCVLRDLGYEPMVIDRRRSATCERLRRYLVESRTKRLRRHLAFAGAWIELLRRRATLEFFDGHLNLSPYCFNDWDRAPKDLGVDCILVGSDQIWNPNINDPTDYMPPAHAVAAPSVAYAASLGTPTVPDGVLDSFGKYLPLFSALSVRDGSSAELLAKIGLEARHVVDPVVLVERARWEALAAREERRAAPKPNVFVYSLGIENTLALGRKLSTFAVRHGLRTELFTGGFEFLPVPKFHHPIDCTIACARNLAYWKELFSLPSVAVRLTAGPRRFLQSLVSSDVVVTNSFHALVFATIFGKNVRYIVPERGPMQAAMVRIADYAGPIVKGPVLQPTTESALASIENGETTTVDFDRLARERAESLTWLKDTLARALGGKAHASS